MKSVWEKDAPQVEFRKLKGNISTDVLIVGGGIAGILCAYKLKNAGIDCTIVEAAEICSGIIKNTTAKITLQHGLLYHKMIKRFGEDKARLYLEAQTRAVREYRELCKGIDCDYEEKDSYVYSEISQRKIKKADKAGGSK